MDKVYYTIELPLHSVRIPGSCTWIEYRGEDTGFGDWWNSSPIRFQSYDDALNCITHSDNFKDSKWQITKTIIHTEIVHSNQ